MGLDIKQLQYLCGLSDFDICYIDGIMTGIKPGKFKYIKVPYNEFRQNMGLDDLRFSWLLGHNNMIAGGSVLTWIFKRDNKSDWDFFFTNQESADNFKRIIEGFGFVETKESTYATTHFHPEDKVVIQVVGATNTDWADGRAYGTPHEVISRFDMGLCRFAVDCDFLYTTTDAIRDLITKSIRIYDNKKLIIDRLVKYRSKGFYTPDEVFKYNEHYESILPTETNFAW